MNFSTKHPTVINFTFHSLFSSSHCLPLSSHSLLATVRTSSTSSWVSTSTSGTSYKWYNYQQGKPGKYIYFSVVNVTLYQ